MKPCIKCKATLPLTAFPENPNCKDGHANVCKDCSARAARIRYRRRHGMPQLPEDVRKPKTSGKPLLPQRGDFPSAAAWHKALREAKASLFGGAKQVHNSKIKSGLQARVTVSNADNGQEVEL